MTDRKKQIMKAVEKLILQKRWNEITTDDVAKIADVGKGTIYRYFKDKNEMFFETALSGLDELCGLLEKNIPKKASFQKKLLGTCMEIGKFFSERSPIIRMIHNEEGRLHLSTAPVREQWHKKRKNLIRIIAAILKEGVSAGLLRKDISTETLAVVLLGMIRTLNRDMEDISSSTKGYKLIVELFCRGAENK